MNKFLERDGHKREGRGAEDGGDGVWCSDGTRPRSEDEDQVSHGDKRDQTFYDPDAPSSADGKTVNERGRDCGSDEPNYDEQCARDACFFFAEVVRREDLV